MLPAPRQFPLKSFVAACAGTLLLLVLTSWLTWRTYLEYESVLVRDIRLQELVDVLENAPIVSTLARSIALTGRTTEVADYRGHSARLDAAISEFREISKSDSLLLHLEMMDRTRDVMDGMEEEAIRLVEAGDVAGAEEVLFGEDYRRMVVAFDRYGNHLEQGLAEQIRTDIHQLKTNSLLAFGVVTGCVPLLVVVWTAIIRTAKFHLDERNRMESELRGLSLQDELTGLYNRRGFTELAEQQWRLARRTGRTMLLVFCDVDELKVINDSHGHALGDAALRETAAILRETFRESDILGRIGGDEFVALVTDFVDSDVRSVQRRVGKGLRILNNSGKLPFALSLSIGYSWYDPREPRPLDELMAQADATMYEQKKSRPHARVFRVI